MITYDELKQELSNLFLSPLGGFHPISEDNAPEECKTLILVGPKEPEFWAIFQKSLEYNDCEPGLDRWSVRVFEALPDNFMLRFCPLGARPICHFILGVTNRSYSCVANKIFGAR